MYLFYILTTIIIFVPYSCDARNSVNKVSRTFAAWRESAVKESLETKNPYTYLGCANTSACSNTLLNECIKDNPSDPSTWVCDCRCDGFGPCNIDKDCCNNACRNGLCSSDLGSLGTPCVGGCFPSGVNECASGYYCKNWGSFGYCDSITSTLSVADITTGTSPPRRTTSYTMFDCSDKKDGDYSDPRNPCSHTYYTCVSGNTFQLTCPADLYFDEQSDECLSKSKVSACD